MESGGKASIKIKVYLIYIMLQINFKNLILKDKYFKFRKMV